MTEEIEKFLNMEDEEIVSYFDEEKLYEDIEGQEQINDSDSEFNNYFPQSQNGSGLDSMDPVIDCAEEVVLTSTSTEAPTKKKKGRPPLRLTAEEKKKRTKRINRDAAKRYRERQKANNPTKS